jgi:hypothetical protein
MPAPRAGIFVFDRIAPQISALKTSRQDFAVNTV